MTPGVYQTSFAGGGSSNETDAFVVRFTANGSDLEYSTYLGGSTAASPDGYDDMGYDIATDSLGYAYVTGYTYSADFPLARPHYALMKGKNDAFISKIWNSLEAPSADITITVTNESRTDETTLPFVITVSNSGPGAVPNVTAAISARGWDLSGGTDIVFPSISTNAGSCTRSSNDISCNIGTLSSGTSASITVTISRPDDSTTVQLAANASSSSIADHLRIHYTTVSKAMSGFEKK